MRDSAGNRSMTLCLALSYGGRESIVAAARALCEAVAQRRARPEEITEERFAAALQTGGLPQLDLLVRTSGEERLSNFLLWEAAYAELYFTDTFWPDFGKTELYEALESYRRPRAPLRPHARADPQRRLRHAPVALPEPRAAPDRGGRRAAARRRADPLAASRWGSALLVLVVAALGAARVRGHHAGRRGAPGCASAIVALGVGLAAALYLRARPARWSGCWRRSSRRRRWCCSTPARSRPPARGWALAAFGVFYLGAAVRAAGAPAARRAARARLGAAGDRA